VAVLDRFVFVATRAVCIRVIILVAGLFGALLLTLVSHLAFAFLVGRRLLGRVALFAFLLPAISFLIVLPVLLLSGHAGSFRLRVRSCIQMRQPKTVADLSPCSRRIICLRFPRGRVRDPPSAGDETCPTRRGIKHRSKPLRNELIRRADVEGNGQAVP